MAKQALDGQPLKYRGLTAEEVESRRRLRGVNLLTPPRREPWWKLYLRKFDDPVIRILIIAAVITVGVGIVEGHYAEGAGILVAIFLATTLAFLNEYKAGREFDILNKVSDDVEVQVLRAGSYKRVPRKEIVVDDIVLIEMGEECPADGELIEAVSLEVDESRLTGESVPAGKRARREST
ncbi:MAG: cation-transporting P-type ATPase, partial [Planctomycetota bacterium]